jgi:23S rRNA pseudouridine1911/1915/1917 synthase
MGCPIRGDAKYGSEFDDLKGSIALHARRLNFIHPVTKAEMNLVAPLPRNGQWTAFLDFEKTD